MPGQSATDVQTLISSDHVDVIQDNTTFDEAWATAVQSTGVPVIALTNYNSDFYPVSQTNDSSNFSVVSTAKATGATKFGELYCAEAAVCQQSIPQIKSIAAKQGVPLVYTAEIAATAPNYTAQCLAAQQAHISTLFVADGPTVLERVASNCSQQGYHPTYVTEGLGFSTELNNAPGLTNMWDEYGEPPILGYK